MGKPGKSDREESEILYSTRHRSFGCKIDVETKTLEAKAAIPAGFPLKSFYDFPTIGLDLVCYNNPTKVAVKIAQESITKGEVLHIHPEWLFQRGTLNHRGPFYETLRTLLNVDQELDGLHVRRHFFVRIAKYIKEYEYLKDIVPSKRLFEKLTERGADVFTFVERKWCCPLPNPSPRWLKTEKTIALLKVTSYADWLNAVGKKTRNMIHKAQENGIKTQIVQPSGELVKGISKFFNDTPIRQSRAFSHHRWTLERVHDIIFNNDGSTIIGAYLQGELIGFIRLSKGDRLTIITQTLSLQQHWDKAVTNALVAKAVEFCAANDVLWLMYGRMENHFIFDNFTQDNGFSNFVLTRYCVPLTLRGRLATRLGLRWNLKDELS